MNTAKTRAEHNAPRRNRRALTRLGIVLAAAILAAVAVPLAVLKATTAAMPDVDKPKPAQAATRPVPSAGSAPASQPAARPLTVTLLGDGKYLADGAGLDSADKLAEAFKQAKAARRAVIVEPHKAAKWRDMRC